MDNGASSYRRFLSGDESDFDQIMKELFYMYLMTVTLSIKQQQEFWS